MDEFSPVSNTPGGAAPPMDSGSIQVSALPVSSNIYQRNNENGGSTKQRALTNLVRDPIDGDRACVYLVLCMCEPEAGSGFGGGADDGDGAAAG